MRVAGMLRNKEGVCIDGWSLCNQIRRLLQLEWEVLVCHTYREANICVDALAHIVCGLDFNVMFYELCPTQMSHLDLANMTGNSIPMLISM
jgi:hypothetical protein